MRKFLFCALLCAIGCGISCSDKEDESGAAGPAGSAELLCGTWGASHMWVEVLGQSSEMDVDASISTITFRADGTATEHQEGGTAYARWSYDPATRILKMVDTNYGTTMDWYVHCMTAEKLIAEFQFALEGAEVHAIVTYDRLSDRSMSVREVRVGETAVVPWGSSFRNNVELN